MEKIKRFSIENILCLFIVLCPVLDMVSFLYRNIFGSLVGCLTDKSSFSQKLNLANIMSATIMETYSNEKGEI